MAEIRVHEIDILPPTAPPPEEPRVPVLLEYPSSGPPEEVEDKDPVLANARTLLQSWRDYSNSLSVETLRENYQPGSIDESGIRTASEGVTLGGANAIAGSVIFKLLTDMATGFGESMINLMEVGKGEREVTPEDMLSTPAGFGLVAGVGRAYPIGSIGVFGSRLAKDSARFGEIAKVADEFQLTYGQPIENFPAEALKRAGLSRDAHGNWVAEISDESAKLNRRINTNELLLGSAKLPDILHHPELYEAFPYLKKVSVQSVDDPDNLGQYIHGRRLITIGEHAKESELIDTLLHEAQHAINAYEKDLGVNRSLGTNPEYVKDQYDRFIGVVNSALDKNEITPEEARSIHGFMSSIKTDYDTYFRNPGEVEARNVITRRHLSEQARREVAPEATEDVPRREQFDLTAFEEVYNKAARGEQIASMKAPDFYSGLERAIDRVKMESAPAEQWLGTIKNAGVKGEELEWTGLEKWLEGRKGEKIGKEEIREFVRQGMPKVKEIVLGGPPEITEYKLRGPRGNIIENQSFKTIEEGQKYLESHPDDFGKYTDQYEVIPQYKERTETKFSEYQLPGGENYREILYTLPRKKGEPLNTEGWSAKQDPDSKMWEVIDSKGKSQGSSYAVNEAEAIRIAAEGMSGRWANSADDFTSSHWDEPNVLAHTRVNDRVIDGKKTLFVEEVQSDWHQKGREQGYKKGPLTLDEIEIEKVSSDVAQEDIGASTFKTHVLSWRKENNIAEDAPLIRYRLRGSEAWNYNWNPDLTNDEILTLAKDFTDRFSSFGLRNLDEGVPNAPFKKTWPEMVLKRLVRDAVDKGYDQIAWTSGATQAERYDLSKQINSISYRKTEEGFNLSAEDLNGDDISIGAGIPENKLSDYVGKDVAKKIIDGEGFTQLAGTTVLNNVDLKVGGEGMKGFYDKMLPSMAKKLFGKDGVEIKTSQIGGYKLEDLEFAFKTGDEWVFRLKDGDKTGYSGKGASEAEARQDALNFLKKYGAKREENTVHTMTITPALRKRVKTEGQTLFSSGLPMDTSDDE